MDGVSGAGGQWGMGRRREGTLKGGWGAERGQGAGVGEGWVLQGTGARNLSGNAEGGRKCAGSAQCSLEAL